MPGGFLNSVLFQRSLPEPSGLVSKHCSSPELVVSLSQGLVAHPGQPRSLRRVPVTLRPVCVFLTGRGGA